MEKFEKGQEIWARGLGDNLFIIGPFEYDEPIAGTSLHYCKSEDSTIILGEDRMVATKRQAITIAKSNFEEEIEAGEKELLKMKSILADFCVTYNIKG